MTHSQASRRCRSVALRPSSGPFFRCEICALGHGFAPTPTGLDGLFDASEYRQCRPGRVTCLLVMVILALHAPLFLGCQVCQVCRPFDAAA
jgi:hypothetical protein